MKCGSSMKLRHLLFLNFVGAKIIIFNMKYESIQSIAYIRHGLQDCSGNKQEKNLSRNHLRKSGFSFHH